MYFGADNIGINLLVLNDCVTVPPMLTISNQLVGGYIGQDIKLECHTEAFPTSINFWTTEKGDMIVSGKQRGDWIV